MSASRVAALFKGTLVPSTARGKGTPSYFRRNECALTSGSLIPSVLARGSVYVIFAITLAFGIFSTAHALGGTADSMCNPYDDRCGCNMIYNKAHDTDSNKPKCIEGGVNSNTHGCPVGVCYDYTSGHVTSGICDAVNHCKGVTCDGKPCVQVTASSPQTLTPNQQVANDFNSLNQGQQGYNTGGQQLPQSSSDFINQAINGGSQSPPAGSSGQIFDSALTNLENSSGPNSSTGVLNSNISSDINPLTPPPPTSEPTFATQPPPPSSESTFAQQPPPAPSSGGWMSSISNAYNSAAGAVSNAYSATVDIVSSAASTVESEIANVTTSAYNSLLGSTQGFDVTGIPAETPAPTETSLAASEPQTPNFGSSPGFGGGSPTQEPTFTNSSPAEVPSQTELTPQDRISQAFSAFETPPEPTPTPPSPPTPVTPQPIQYLESQNLFGHNYVSDQLDSVNQQLAYVKSNLDALGCASGGCSKDQASIYNGFVDQYNQLQSTKVALTNVLNISPDLSAFTSAPRDPAAFAAATQNLQNVQQLQTIAVNIDPSTLSPEQQMRLGIYEGVLQDAMKALRNDAFNAATNIVSLTKTPTYDTSISLGQQQVWYDNAIKAYQAAVPFSNTFFGLNTMNQEGFLGDATRYAANSSNVVQSNIENAIMNGNYVGMPQSPSGWNSGNTLASDLYAAGQDAAQRASEYFAAIPKEYGLSPGGSPPSWLSTTLSQLGQAATNGAGYLFEGAISGSSQAIARALDALGISPLSSDQMIREAIDPNGATFQKIADYSNLVAVGYPLAKVGLTSILGPGIDATMGPVADAVKASFSDFAAPLDRGAIEAPISSGLAGAPVAVPTSGLSDAALAEPKISEVIVPEAVPAAGLEPEVRALAPEFAAPPTENVTLGAAPESSPPVTEPTLPAEPPILAEATPPVETTPPVANEPAPSPVVDQMKVTDSTALTDTQKQAITDASDALKAYDATAKPNYPAQSTETITTPSSPSQLTPGEVTKPTQETQEALKQYVADRITNNNAIEDQYLKPNGLQFTRGDTYGTTGVPSGVELANGDIPVAKNVGSSLTEVAPPSTEVIAPLTTGEQKIITQAEQIYSDARASGLSDAAATAKLQTDMGFVPDANGNLIIDRLNPGAEPTVVAKFENGKFTDMTGAQAPASASSAFVVGTNAAGRATIAGGTTQGVFPEAALSKVESPAIVNESPISTSPSGAQGRTPPTLWDTVVNGAATTLRGGLVASTLIDPLGAATLDAGRFMVAEVTPITSVFTGSTEDVAAAGGIKFTTTAATVSDLSPALSAATPGAGIALQGAAPIVAAEFKAIRSAIEYAVPSAAPTVAAIGDGMQAFMNPNVSMATYLPPETVSPTSYEPGGLISPTVTAEQLNPNPALPVSTVETAANGEPTFAATPPAGPVSSVTPQPVVAVTQGPALSEPQPVVAVTNGGELAPATNQSQPAPAPVSPAPAPATVSPWTNWLNSLSNYFGNPLISPSQANTAAQNPSNIPSNLISPISIPQQSGLSIEPAPSTAQPAPATKPINAVVTFYAPGGGGKIEGGFVTSKPDLAGKFVPHTLDDVRLGKSTYITLASAPENQGKFINLGSVTYTSPIDNKTYTLDNVNGYVHDTGAAFNPAGVDKNGNPTGCAAYNTCSVRLSKYDVPVGNFAGWSATKASTFVNAQPYGENVTHQWAQTTSPASVASNQPTKTPQTPVATPVQQQSATPVAKNIPLPRPRPTIVQTPQIAETIPLPKWAPLPKTVTAPVPAAAESGLVSAQSPKQVQPLTTAESPTVPPPSQPEALQPQAPIPPANVAKNIPLPRPRPAQAGQTPATPAQPAPQVAEGIPLPQPRPAPSVTNPEVPKIQAQLDQTNASLAKSTKDLQSAQKSLSDIKSREQQLAAAPARAATQLRTSQTGLAVLKGLFSKPEPGTPQAAALGAGITAAGQLADNVQLMGNSALAGQIRQYQAATAKLQANPNIELKISVVAQGDALVAAVQKFLGSYNGVAQLAQLKTQENQYADTVAQLKSIVADLTTTKRQQQTVLASAQASPPSVPGGPAAFPGSAAPPATAAPSIALIDKNIAAGESKLAADQQLLADKSSAIAKAQTAIDGLQKQLSDLNNSISLIDPAAMNKTIADLNTVRSQLGKAKTDLNNLVSDQNVAGALLQAQRQPTDQESAVMTQAKNSTDRLRALAKTLATNPDLPTVVRAKLAQLVSQIDTYEKNDVTPLNAAVAKINAASLSAKILLAPNVISLAQKAYTDGNSLLGAAQSVVTATDNAAKTAIAQDQGALNKLAQMQQDQKTVQQQLSDANMQLASLQKDKQAIQAQINTDNTNVTVQQEEKAQEIQKEAEAEASPPAIPGGTRSFIGFVASLFAPAAPVQQPQTPNPNQPAPAPVNTPFGQPTLVTPSLRTGSKTITTPDVQQTAGDMNPPIPPTVPPSSIENVTSNTTEPSGGGSVGGTTPPGSSGGIPNTATNKVRWGRFALIGLGCAVTYSYDIWPCGGLKTTSPGSGTTGAPPAENTPTSAPAEQKPTTVAPVFIPAPEAPRPSPAPTPTPQPQPYPSQQLSQVPYQGAGNSSSLSGFMMFMIGNLIGQLMQSMFGVQQTQPTPPPSLPPLPPTSTSTPAAIPPSVLLVANPGSVAPGQSSVLSWSTTGVARCVIGLQNVSMIEVPVEGSTGTSPLATTTTYTLGCSTGSAVSDLSTSTVLVSTTTVIVR